MRLVPALGTMLGLPAVLTAQVSTIEILPARATVVAGQEVRFTIRAKDSSGASVEPRQVVWLAGPPDVAAAKPDGVVRTYRQGSARVLARIGNKVAHAELTVEPKPPATVQVVAEAAEVVPGGITVVRAVPLTEDREPLSNQPVTFTSTNPQIATVVPAGAILGRTPGETTIIAEAGGARGEVRIRVVPNRVAQLGLTGPAAARTGDVVRFTIRARDGRGLPIDHPGVRWSVSSGGATVFPDGAFVAEEPGLYVVSAAVGVVSAAAPVTVTPRVHDRSFETVNSIVFKDLQPSEQWAIGNVLYVGTIADRLYTYDISDPANPRLSDSLIVDARLINDVSTTADGKIGVITRQGASSRKNGIVFLDLADPLRPKILSEYTATVSGGVHSAFVYGRHVYLTDDGTASMKVISFEDPKQPREVAHWQVENSFTRLYPDQVEARYLHDIQVKDGLAYLAYWRDGVVILDVGRGLKGGSPENPQLVSRFTYNTADFYPPDMLAGSHTVFRFRNYLIVGDEVFPQFFDVYSRDRIKTLGRLHILDVSDIEHPKKVAEYSVPNSGSHNVWVEDDVLYVGNFEAGLRAVDVSGELRGDLYAQGREIGSIWTASANGFRPNVPMTWGAQPHKGHVYATDMNSGVWIAKLTPKRLVP